jgi:tellurium resistance protein TerZ
MAISLKKGQKVDLRKRDNSSLKKVRMGLGWDPVKATGFFAKLFSFDSIDLDASCLLFDKNKKLLQIIYYANLQSSKGAIIHTGDNLTGEGDGDDESIRVDLEKLPQSVYYLAFTINSFEGHTFDQVENAFCRLIDESTEQEICRYTLSEKGKHTGVIMATISRTPSGWLLKAIGAPGRGRKASEIVTDVLEHL